MGWCKTRLHFTADKEANTMIHERKKERCCLSEMSLCVSPSSPGVFVAVPSDLQIRCLRFTDGFFQGSVKVICGLARLVFSMLRIQFTTCNLGRGIWRTASPSRKDSIPGSQRGLQQSIGAWWCRAWVGGSGACCLSSLLSGCTVKAVLGAQPTFRAPEGGTNAACRRVLPQMTRLLQKPLAYFPFFLCSNKVASPCPSWPPLSS